MTDITLPSLLTSFRKNVADAETLLKEEPIGFALINEDATLAMISDGTQFRLGSLLSNKVELFMLEEDATRACRNWNRQLTNAQRTAGCLLRLVSFEDALSIFIATQKKMITILEAHS